MKMNSLITKSLSLCVVALLATSFNAQAKNAMHIVINDHLGTPQMLVDENQHVVWKANYDEFGKATIQVEEVEFNQRFPGQYYDKETGLNYNYYRDYDASNGRYVQSDPIGLDGGINTYGYVGGNPVSYVDPTGENAVAVAACLADFPVCTAVGGALLYCSTYPEKCTAAAQVCVDATVKFSDMMGGSSITPIIVAAIISSAVEGDSNGDFIGNNPPNKPKSKGQNNTDLEGNGDAEGVAKELGKKYGEPSGSPEVNDKGQVSYPNGVQVRPGEMMQDGRPRVNLPAGVGGPYTENIHINQ